MQKKFNIVSGLATGCDTIAHKSCLACGGKTIAILPTTFSNVFPKENAGLVDEIVNAGGLIITEYVSEPKSRGERINRFIERDRLQAMFVKAVVLVASYLPGAGDSGSRHAMQKAKEYGKHRLVMYNPIIDLDSPLFGLNKKLLSEGVEQVTAKSLRTWENP